MCDPEMPFIAQALDTKSAAAHMRPALGDWMGPVSRIDVRSARVVRHKPGRRCLIAYQVAIERERGWVEWVNILGKMRSKGVDLASYNVQADLYAGEFGHDAADGISVPEPIGVVPALHLWLQRMVEGRPATGLFLEPAGLAVAERMANASHKLHRAGVPTHRQHTVDDELTILMDRLKSVATRRPDLAWRLARIMAQCEQLGLRLPKPDRCGIHRDYYGDQVIVDGARLVLVDLDLYCLGDPGLDIGNAIAHLTEQALRMSGDPTALCDRERALEERFVQLAGEHVRPSVRAYTTLTLARHISLSTRIPDRGHTTEALLRLCEERLSDRR